MPMSAGVVQSFVLLLLLSLLGAPRDTSSCTLSLDLDTHTPVPSYRVRCGAVELAGASSAPLAARVRGKWLLPQEHLVLVNESAYSGHDPKFGPYKAVEFLWGADAAGFADPGFLFGTAFLVFAERNAAVFRQTFPLGASAGCATGDNRDVAAGAFPIFDPARGSPRLTYFSFADSFAKAHIGPFDGNATDFVGGGQGGAPLALYARDSAGLDTVVVSPLRNFMVGNQVFSPTLGVGGALFACGVQGRVESLPRGFVHDTLVVGAAGVNRAFDEWGALLLLESGKRRGVSDVAIARLGYWTDNGAYYYYTTEGAGKNYEDTMIDVDRYAVGRLALPVRHWQMDSWWYLKGPDGGVALWEPRADIFPHGMQYVDAAIGSLPLVLHNRWFSPENEYLRDFPFYVEERCALPKTEELYVHIMKRVGAHVPQGRASAQGGGLAVYEQDWLVTTYNTMNVTQNNVDVARRWMLHMGSAASRLGLTIQLCMPLPYHILQSTESPSMTQCRASDDYQPGNNQWMIGYSSMLLWAVGLTPFKDNFWTTPTQSGCRYRSCTEPNVELQTLVAALSCGPVGFGDKINATNATLVLRTCNADGTLLKPDRPAMAIDKVFRIFGPSSDQPFSSLWHVWDTCSAQKVDGREYRWHYVFAAATPEPLDVYPQDLNLEAGSLNAMEVGGTWKPFDVAHPMHIAKLAGSVDAPVKFVFVRTAPQLPHGWFVLGETGKFASMAAQRWTRVAEVSEETLTLELAGGHGEVIDVSIVPPHGDLASPVYVKCTFAARSGSGSGSTPAASVVVACRADGNCTCG